MTFCRHHPVLGIAWLAALLLTAPRAALAGENRAKVIPFSIDTYHAISRDDIIEAGREVCVLLKPGTIAALVSRATPSPAKFQDGLVRGLLEEDGDAIFVDVNGLFDYGQKSYRVTETALKDTINEHFKCETPSLSE